MRVYADLHIHSALSPCADNDMTPNNIVNMAWIKGLDIIAITDHNSVENCEAVQKLACSKGILAIPGMEVETREEVHVLCYFPDICSAVKVQEVIWSHLPNIKNRVEIFGEQLKMDIYDNVTEQIEKMLVTASDIGIDDLFMIVESLGGICVPAHVDRASYSLLSNLGFIPEDINVNFIEVSKNCSIEKFLDNNRLLKKYGLIRSSDAHILGDILEKDFSFELNELSIESIIKTLSCI